MRNPLCVQCKAEGVIRVLDEWDHVVPLWAGGADTEDNLAGLCKPHHDAKSAREAAERARGDARRIR
jgi:5-methylcytosine-specific restriction protein A